MVRLSGIKLMGFGFGAFWICVSLHGWIKARFGFGFGLALIRVSLRVWIQFQIGVGPT